MMKLISSQPKWLAGLIILVIASLLIGSCVPVNKYPVISSLDAERDWVMSSASCEIECVASDENGDSLNYTWSATRGTLSGTGPVVTWMAPHTPGTYTITVKVADGRDGETTRQLTMYVSASANQPPIIERLTAQRRVVRNAMTSTIECVASDPNGDELSYIWSVNGGTISGEGPVVTWVAPNAYGSYAVTVTVTDGRSGEAVESISIKVTCCV